MLFNSFNFIIFFSIVFIVYYSINHKYRWILLLLASYFFYMAWRVEYVILILIPTIVDFICARYIFKTDKEKIKLILLLLSLFSNLSLLFVFKYFNFFQRSIFVLMSHFGVVYVPLKLSVLLPIGISFYIFKTISYTIDVYRRDIEPENNFFRFALYVSFFPQILAGPIARAKNLLPQFRYEVSFDYNKVSNGMKLVGWGLFKKVVIADRLAILVDFVYTAPADQPGVNLIIASVFFTFQIYCDFSGYSDMAIGIAQMLGFQTMDNFNRPYHADSIRDFWRRWHISLSTWFRDYLYIPLGGNKGNRIKVNVNTIITFLISGIWHGANWTFVVWGLYHGILLVLENLIRKNFVFLKLPKSIKIILTFFSVNIGWIFFRADSISDAVFIIKKITIGFVNDVLNNGVIFNFQSLGISQFDFIVSLCVILFMEFIHFMQNYGSIRKMLSLKSVQLRFAIYYIFVISIIILGKFGENKFIYFQF